MAAIPVYQDATGWMPYEWQVQQVLDAALTSEERGRVTTSVSDGGWVVIHANSPEMEHQIEKIFSSYLLGK